MLFKKITNYSFPVPKIYFLPGEVVSVVGEGVKQNGELNPDLKLNFKSFRDVIAKKTARIFSELLASTGTGNLE